MSDSRLAWHVVIGPVAGALIGTGAYVQLVRPYLGGPGWLLDSGASLCGAAGLLAGGVLVFRLWPIAVDGQAASPPHRARTPWSPAGAFGFSTLALVAALVLTGVPLTPWSAIAVAIVGGVVAVVLRR